MRITLDRSIDAAYIYLSSSISENMAAKTYLCDPVEVGTQINLDFDALGQFIGIEIMGASKHLPIELLKIAEKIN